MKLMNIGKFAFVCLAAFTTAHPGEVEQGNAAGDLAKRQFDSNACRSLAKYANHPEYRGILARAEARRGPRSTPIRKRPANALLSLSKAEPWGGSTIATPTRS